jgi:hypothetical protein
MAHNFHTNAAALIIAAAKQSGLLDEIANALCFIDKVPNPSFDCRACELLSALTDAFDKHVGDDSLADDTVGQFHGESWEGFPQYSEEELRPYFSVPFETHVETDPPRFSIDFDSVYDAEKVKAALEFKYAEFKRWIEANRSNAPSA